jgi:hypothetical protein
MKQQAKQKFPVIKILAGIIGGACAGLFVAPAASAAEAAPELAGLWQMPQCPGGSGGGMNRRCMEVAEDDPKLTERAKAYHDAIDEFAQPKYDCAPMPIPMMWSEPYSFAIEQLEDRVLIRYGKEEVVRTIWLEGAGGEGLAEPKYNEFFYYGHSVGRYEDGALVAVTDRFTFDPQGWNADHRIPSSTQKQLLERFSREGDALVLEVTSTDPFFLKEPLTYRVTAQPETQGWDFEWACDLEASRSILKVMAPQYPGDPPIEYIDYEARP